MKKAKVLILIMAVMLLATGCYSSEDIELARQEGYDSGYFDGYDEGYNDGESSERYQDKWYEEGYNTGYHDAEIEYELKTVETECPKCKNKFTIWAEDGTLYE